MNNFSDKLLKISEKLNNNKVIESLKSSFLVLTPFIILASIATLFSSLVCSPNTGLASMPNFKFLANYTQLFSSISYGCLNIIALLIAFNMGYNMARQLNIDSHFGGLLGLVSYVCMSPTTFNVLGVKETVLATGLSQEVTASTGMFYAMVVSVIAVYIYSALVKIKKLKITFPDSVPSNVGNAFSSLIPTILTVFILCIIRFAYYSITGSELSALVYSFIQVPINAVIQTPFGFIGAAVLGALFWFFGIHGSSIVSALMNPVLIGALTVNIELVNSGKQATEIVTRPFNFMFASMGGFGCTLCLIIAILLVGKREDEKMIAKLALPSGIFAINEPMIFGLPIVMNPIYAIPFMIAPVIGSVIGYVATNLGLMAITYIDVPWCMPPFINAFLATGGDFRAVLVQLVAFIAITAIYIPFVKISNKAFIKMNKNKEVGEENVNE